MAEVDIAETIVRKQLPVTTCEIVAVTEGLGEFGELLTVK